MIQIDCDYPGGNILVESIDGDRVRLRQDLRDTRGWWFYWNFRVLGARGRRLTFEFTNKDVFGTMGPACRFDEGPWHWLGLECTEGTSFSLDMGPHDRAQLAFCIPYVPADLEAFLAARQGVERSAIGTTRQGRPLELLTLNSRTGRLCVVLLARSHACETMASFVLEGLMDYWLAADEPAAEALRRDVDFRVVPFVDCDGVERGDQGKGRTPHDHHGDWTGSPIHPETRAIMEHQANWRGGKLLSLDLHCPWLRGPLHANYAFFISLPQPWQARLETFRQILERTQTAGISYRPQDDIELGFMWNTNTTATAHKFFNEHTPVDFATTLEFPYARCAGRSIGPDDARAFGKDLARAIGLYIVQT